MELILGTAEFGPRPYGEGVKQPLTRDEVRSILKLALASGITTLDTADSYGYDLEEEFKPFNCIVKTRDVTKQLNNTLYHYIPYEKPLTKLWGSSIYDIEQFDTKHKICQMPFNIDTTEFQCLMGRGPKVHVRGVFDRGKLLKKGYTVKQCLDFVRRYEEGIDAVVVGVNSTKELECILKLW